MPTISSRLAEIRLLLRCTETYSGGSVDGKQLSVGESFAIKETRLNSSSTPPVTADHFQTYSLVAGSKTLDLTSLLDTLGNALDASGKKVQALILVNPDGNHDLTLGADATNGYTIGPITVHGSSSGPTAGLLWLPEALADVGSGAKRITVTGTGTESFSIGLLAG